MGRKVVVNIRKAWEDKYRVPTVAELAGALEAPHGEYFRLARAGLIEIGAERLSWLGIPWRWSLVYSHKGSRPLAYLVPQPSRPLMVIPLAAALSAETMDGKLSRPVRDGIMHAPVVGQMRWTQWELSSKAQVEELVSLARACREELSAAAGAV